LICKESENRAFRFPGSKKATDGLFTTSSFDFKKHFSHEALRT